MTSAGWSIATVDYGEPKQRLAAYQVARAIERAKEGSAEDARWIVLASPRWLALFLPQGMTVRNLYEMTIDAAGLDDDAVEAILAGASSRQLRDWDTTIGDEEAAMSV